MGQITEKTVFVTSDGEQFPTLQAAKSHNETVELAGQLEYEFDFTSATALNLAEWIIKRYNAKDPE